MNNKVVKISDNLVKDINKRVFYCFRRISQIPRGSGNEQAIADWLVDFAKLYGFKYTRSPADEYVHTPDEIMYTDTVIKVTELLIVALWQMKGSVAKELSNDVFYQIIIKNELNKVHCHLHQQHNRRDEKARVCLGHNKDLEGKYMYRPINSNKIGDSLKFKAYTKLLENPDINEGLSNSYEITGRIMNNIDEMFCFTDNEGYDVVIANRIGTGAVLYYFGDGLPSLDGFHVPVIGEQLCAAYDEKGRYTVFVKNKNKIYYSVENSPHSGCFTEQKELTITLPRDFTGIEKIGVLQTPKGYVFYAASAAQTITHKVYFVTYCDSVDNNDHMIETSFHPGDILLSGETQDNFCVHGFSNIYSVYNIRNKVRDDYTISEENRIEKAKITGDRIVGLRTDGDIVEIGVNGGEMTALTVIIGANKNWWDVRRAAHNRKDVYHVAFADNTDDKRLGHALAEGAGKKDTEIFYLDKNVIAPVFSERNNVTLYYINAGRQGDSVLVKLDYDAASSNWTETVLDIPQPGVPRLRKCYSTEAYFYDEFDMPIPDMEIEINTKSRGYIEVDGLLRLTSPDRKIKVKTDAMGKLSFLQYTNKIDVPEIEASLPQGVLGANETLTFSQYEAATGNFKDVTPDDLLDAKTVNSMDSKEEDLLTGDFRTKKNAEDMANVINQLYSLAGFNDNPYAKGCYITTKGLTEPRRISPLNNNLPSWSLDVDGTNLTYTNLSSSEAKEQIQQMCQSAGRVIMLEGGDGFFSRIGSFFRSIAKGIAKVVKIIVDAVETVVKCIINGIEVVFKGVIKFVTDVLNFIEMLFAAVLIFFVVLFMWIAALFMWKDVKLTQRLIRGMFSVCMNKLPKVAPYMKNVLIKGLDDAGVSLDKFIDEATAKIAPNTPIAKHIRQEAKDMPEEEEALSNNMLLNRLSRDISKDCDFVIGNDILLKYSGEFDSIMAEITKLTGSVKDEPSFEAARQYIFGAFDGKENIFRAMLASILQALNGLMQLALKAVKSLVSKIMDLIGKMLDAIAEIFTREIRLPFFSSFYKVITGDELSWLNLLSFVGAVPVVLVTKLIAGRTLIEDEKAADLILDEYSALFDGMLDGKDITSTTKMSKDGRQIFGICSLVYGVAGNASGVTINAITFMEMDSNERLGLIKLVCKIIKFGADFPLIYDDGDAVYCSKIAMYVLTFVDLAVGVVIKVVNNKDIEEVEFGDIYTCISGGVYLGFTIWYAAESGGEKWWIILKEISLSILNISKIIIYFFILEKKPKPEAWKVPEGLKGAVIVFGIINAVIAIFSAAYDISKISNPGDYTEKPSNALPTWA